MHIKQYVNVLTDKETVYFCFGFDTNVLACYLYCYYLPATSSLDFTVDIY